MRYVLSFLAGLVLIGCQGSSEPAKKDNGGEEQEQVPAVQAPSAPGPAQVNLQPVNPVLAAEQDPTLYDGKTLKQWLTLLNHPDRNIRQAAIPLAAKHGAKILPAIMAKFANSNEKDNETTLDLLVEIGAPAVPFLARVLEGKDPGPRYQAGLALNRMANQVPFDEQAIASLANVLKGTDPNLHYVTVRILSQLGPQARQASSALAEFLAKEPTVDKALAHWQVSGESAVALRALGAILQTADAPEREQATLALAGFVASGSQAVALLQGALTDQDVRVRSAAVMALCPFGELARPALPAMLKTLPPRINESTAQALAMFGPDAKDAVPAICGMMRKMPDRKGYGKALVAIGSASLPELVKVLGDTEPRARIEAARVLAQFGRAAQDTAPALVEALKDQHPDVRQEAAQALRLVNPEAARQAGVAGETR